MILSKFVDELIDLFPLKDDKVNRCLVGKAEKQITDTVPKSARFITVEYDSIEYTIVLLPKLELYLLYHSQIIKRNDTITVISFQIYDEDDKALEDIEPSVKYTLISEKRAAQVAFSPSVLSNKRGVYSFNVPVGHLSRDVKKIKIELRDIPSRKKPLETRTFRLE